MKKAIIKEGDKYNKLTAIKFSYRKREQFWLFKCDCGNKKVISVNYVKRGQIKSCRCLLKKGGRLTHKMTKTRTYKSWRSMKDRCLNKKTKRYKDYGGRGITICDRWMKFKNFFDDMGYRPEKKSLDRIRNEMGYCKENCRWATQEEQQNNRRNNHLLKQNGKMKTIAQLSRDFDIKYSILYSRIKRGWSIERALTW